MKLKKLAGYKNLYVDEIGELYGTQELVDLLDSIERDKDAI